MSRRLAQNYSLALFRRLAPWNECLLSEFASKSSMSHRSSFKDSSTNKQLMLQRSLKVYKISTIKPLLINNVCIELSIVLQGPIKESSMIHHWSINGNINVSMISTSKVKSSLMFASKSSLFQQCSFEESSANHQRHGNETWKFRRLIP